MPPIKKKKVLSKPAIDKDDDLSSETSDNESEGESTEEEEETESEDAAGEESCEACEEEAIEAIQKEVKKKQLVKRKLATAAKDEIEEEMEGVEEESKQIKKRKKDISGKKIQAVKAKALPPKEIKGVEKLLLKKVTAPKGKNGKMTSADFTYVIEKGAKVKDVSNGLLKYDRSQYILDERHWVQVGTVEIKARALSFDNIIFGRNPSPETDQTQKPFKYTIPIKCLEPAYRAFCYMTGRKPRNKDDTLILP